LRSIPDFRAWHDNESWGRRKGLNFEIAAASIGTQSPKCVPVSGIGGAPSWANTV
jgi:hypothetical protein